MVPSTVTETLDLLESASISSVRGGSTADLMLRGAGFPSTWFGTSSAGTSEGTDGVNKGTDSGNMQMHRWCEQAKAQMVTVVAVFKHCR